MSAADAVGPGAAGPSTSPSTQARTYRLPAIGRSRTRALAGTRELRGAGAVVRSDSAVMFLSLLRRSQPACGLSVGSRQTASGVAGMATLPWTSPGGGRVDVHEDGPASG